VRAGKKLYFQHLEQKTVNVSLANLEAIAIGLNCLEADLVMPIRTGSLTNRGE